AWDRAWGRGAANASVATLLAGVDPQLLQPPVNVMCVSLHPRGLAPLIVNLAEWGGALPLRALAPRTAHLARRLRGEDRVPGDGVIDALLKELTGSQTGLGRQADRPAHGHQDAVAV